MLGPWLFLVAWGTEVSVLGVGLVSLDEATTACLEGQSLGPVQGRSPVVADVLQVQLERDPEERSAYFEWTKDDPWPTASVQIATVPGLPWTPTGAIAACTAVGQHWIAEGKRLRTLCIERKVCRESLPEDQWRVVYDLTQQGAEDPERLFLALRKHEPPLGLFEDPLPFLDKACEGPKNAARKGWLLDRNDLDSARTGCLQLLALVEGDVPPRIDRGCESSWSQTDQDAAQLVLVSGTTMSVGARVGPGHRDRLHSQVAAMDPTGETCPSSWGDLHKGNVVEDWREAQRAAACQDDSLDLRDRVVLCPSFRGQEQARCMQGEADGCMRAATMAIEGIGSEVMLQPAVDLYRRACLAGSKAGCAEVHGQRDRIDAWFAAALAETTPVAPEPAPEPEPIDPEPGEALPPPAPPEVPDSAPGGFDEAGRWLEEYGEILGERWSGDRRVALAEAHLALWQVEEAATVLDQGSGTASVEEPWAERLQQVLQSRQAWDEWAAAQRDAEEERPAEGAGR